MANTALNRFHQSALTHPFWQRILFVGFSVLGAALSYLLYPVLAQILTPAQFGDVGIVVALSGQITGILLAFNVVSIYLVHTQSAEDASRTTSIIQKILIQILLVATVLVLVASPWLMQVLKIESLWTLLGLGLTVLLSVPGVVWTGFLQGHSELTRIGLFNAVGAGSKLVLASALCLMGWGAPGAVFGIIGSQFIGFWLLHVVPGTELPPAHGSLKKITEKEWQIVRPLARYVGQSLAVVAMFSMLFAIDIVLAKVMFSQHEAGIYAGIASLGRTVFFGASILIWIMLAGINPNDLKTSRVILRRYIGLIALGGVAAAGIFIAWGGPIVQVSLGRAYVDSSPLLWWVAVNQTMSVLLYAYTLYLLVMRRGRPATLAILVSMGALLSVLWGPADTLGLIVSLFAGQLIGLILYGILIGIDTARKKRSA